MRRALLLYLGISISALDPLGAEDFLDRVDLTAAHPLELRSDLGTANGHVNIERTGPATIRVTYHADPDQHLSGFWEGNVSGDSVEMVVACFNFIHVGFYDSIQGEGSARGTGKNMRLEIVWEFVSNLSGRARTHSVREIITLTPRGEESESDRKPGRDPDSDPTAEGTDGRGSRPADGGRGEDPDDEEGENPDGEAREDPPADPRHPRCAWSQFYAGRHCQETAPEKGERGCACPAEFWHEDAYFREIEAAIQDLRRIEEARKEKVRDARDLVLLLRYVEHVRGPLVAAVKGVDRLVPTMTDRIARGLLDAQERVAAVLAEIREACLELAAKFKRAMEIVGEEFTEGLERAVENLEEIADFDLELSWSAVEKVLSKVGQVKDLITEGIEDLTDVVKAVVDELPGLLAAMRTTADRVFASIGELIDTVTDALSDVLSATLDLVSSTEALVRDLVGAVQEGTEAIPAEDRARLDAEYGLSQPFTITQGLVESAIDLREALRGPFPSVLERFKALQLVIDPFGALLSGVRDLSRSLSFLHNVVALLTERESSRRLAELLHVESVSAPDPRGGELRVGQILRAMNELGLGGLGRPGEAPTTSDHVLSQEDSPCARERNRILVELIARCETLGKEEAEYILEYLSLQEGDIVDLLDTTDLAHIDAGLLGISIDIDILGDASGAFGLVLEIAGAATVGGLGLPSWVGLVNSTIGMAAGIGSTLLTVWDGIVSHASAIVALDSMRSLVGRFDAAVPPIYGLLRDFLAQLGSARHIEAYMTPSCEN